MLIDIHSSVADIPNHTSTSISRALNALSRSYIDGDHVLVSDLRTLRKLAKRSDISVIAEKGFAKAQSDLPQNKSLRDFVSESVLVVDTVSQPSTQGAATIHVDIRNFASASLSLPTHLVGESYEDTDFFRRVGEYYAYVNGAPGLRIKARASSGGGGSTKFVFSRKQQTGDLVLCIVDSDKDSPSGKMGGTARGVRKKRNPSSSLSHVFVLPARETENMLPDELLRRALSLTQHSQIRRLGEIGDLDCEARRYVDMKGGLRFEKVLSMPKVASQQFWTGIASSIFKSGVKRTFQRCKKFGKCMGGSNCTCTILNNMGSNTLSECIKEIEDYNRQELAQVVEGCAPDTWEKAGELVATWCCGKTRAIM